MLCEIEFLPVGEGSRAGDAIVVRYGEENDYKLMVVDGGTADSGKELVTHIKRHFGEQVRLEHVVLTHSDADHASGLREVLRQIQVVNLWLHIPWLLSQDAIHLFQDKNWTKETLASAIKKEYDIISEIVDLGMAAPHTTVQYPFQGSQIGPFTVLSPRWQNYLYLLPQFEKTPAPDQALLEAADMWIGKSPTGLFKALLEKAAAKVSNWLPETWSQERLKDGGNTSASNESSVVLYGDFGSNRRVLLTGDAGLNALTWSISHATTHGAILQQFSFVQIPHHGSRRNVGPAVLNQLLGPIQPQGTKRFTAFVSAPKQDDQHPRKIVLNAFMRRGGEIHATQGQSKVHWGGFKPRNGYSAVTPLAFSQSVESYD